MDVLKGRPLTDTIKESWRQIARFVAASMLSAVSSMNFHVLMKPDKLSVDQQAKIMVAITHSDIRYTSPLDIK